MRKLLFILVFPLAVWAQPVAPPGATAASGINFTQSGTGTAQAKLTETVNAADFGCVGDGATDNTACFNKIGAYMRSHNATVTFNPGTYEYTNPLWLSGPIAAGKIVGYGASFQNNQSASAAHVSSIALAVGKMDIWTAGPYYGGGTPTAPSNLIVTVAAGTNSVTLQSTGSYANFTSCMTVSTGCHAIVMGYDEMHSGWPPAERYFDYVTVTAVNSSTGVVTFDRNLRNSYDSRWANELKSVITTGAPTITPIDGTPGGGWIQNLTIEGVTFLDNPTHPRSGGTYGLVYVTTTDSFECIRCILAHGVPHETNRVTFTKSTIHSGGAGGSAFEIDKLTDTFIFQNGETLNGGAFSQCASTNNLIILNSTITGNHPCPAKHIVWSGNTISGDNGYQMITGVGDGGAPPEPIYDLSITNNTFIPRKPLAGLVETYNEGHFTVSAVSGSGPYILTTPIVFSSFPNAVQTVVPGSVVRTSGNVKAGKVTSVYMSGNNMQVEVSMTKGTPAVDDEFSFSSVLHMTVRGNRQTGGYGIPNIRPSKGNRYSGPDFNDVIDDDAR